MSKGKLNVGSFRYDFSNNYNAITFEQKELEVTKDKFGQELCELDGEQIPLSVVHAAKAEENDPVKVHLVLVSRKNTEWMGNHLRATAIQALGCFIDQACEQITNVNLVIRKLRSEL